MIKGYRTHTCFTDKPSETLYAVYDDGRVYRTEPLSIRNDTFDKIGRPWFPVEALPADAMFIGNYSPVRGAK